MTKPRFQRSVRATLTGLIVNALLVAGKMAAGILGHSHALVADAVESLADVVSSLIVWRGLVVAAAPADDDHPYGHGKAEAIAAAVVSGMLLMAALWIGVTAVREIVRPHQAPAPFTLAVLLAVIFSKETLFRFVLREAAQVESTAVHTDAWHHRSDAITSLAAALGIAVALLGGPGYEMADDVAALLAACIIAWNGWRLVRPAVDELMDMAPTQALVESIREIAATVPQVREVEKCIVRKAGYHLFVDMHVEVDPLMTVERAHSVAHEVKEAVRARMPKVSDVLVHIEPLRTEGATPPETPTNM